MLWIVHMRCPVCGHVLATSAAGGAVPPFCSARCRAIDLGRWLTESYRIPGPSVQEEAEGLADLTDRMATSSVLAEEDPC